MSRPTRPRLPMRGAVPAVSAVWVLICCVMLLAMSRHWPRVSAGRRRRPIRLVGVLGIPERTAVAYDGYGLEVLRGRGRGRRPLKGKGVPGIGSLGGRFSHCNDKVREEDQHRH